MELVLKVYSATFDSSPIIQTFELDAVKITERLNDFSYLEISMPFTSDLREFQKVELFEVEEGTDTLVFTWFIYDFRPNLQGLNLICRDQKALFKKMLVYSEKNFSTSIETILEELLSDRNTRATESWIVDTLLSTSASINMLRWDNYFDTINELADLVDAQWWIKTSGVLTMNTILGEDKTSGVNFTEAVYDANASEENNITNVEVENFWTISNAIIWDNDSWVQFQNDSTSIANFGRLEEFKKFSDWNITSFTASYLAEKKVAQKIYNVDLETGSLPSINIWDLISLRIEGVSEYLDFDWATNVINKTIEYKNRTKIQTVSLWEVNVKIPSFTGRIKLMESEINKLQL